MNIVLDIKEGKTYSKDHKPMIVKLPAIVENFVGRQVECQTIVEMLQENRYVCIEGIPGIGKSALVKHVANILYDRCIFEDGILYVTLRDMNSLESFLKKLHLSIHIFINTKGFEDKNLETTDIYWEILRFLKDLHILLIFDNCRDIVEKDQNSFQEFIQDILEKLPKLRILMTCSQSVSLFNDVKTRVFKVKGLTDRQTLELLKLNAESFKTHNEELDELLQADPKYETSLKQNIFQHEIFGFLDGHPLSTMILSSLRRNNMSLREIFEFLKKIKKNYYNERIDQSTLSLMLSVEASLIFAKTENKLSYEVLLVLALSPSGFLDKHLIDIFGEKFNSCQQLLLSRSLVKSKPVPFAEISEQRLYFMDLALIKIIKSRTNSDELEGAYQKITAKILEILQELIDKRYENNGMISQVICLYEGNIWSVIDKHTGNLNADDSDSEEFLNIDTGGPQIPRSEHKAKYLLRVGTYRDRKKTMIKHLFSGLPEDSSKNISHHGSPQLQLPKVFEPEVIDEEPKRKDAIFDIKNMIKSMVAHKIVNQKNESDDLKSNEILEENDSEIHPSELENEAIELDDIYVELDDDPLNLAQNHKLKSLITFYNKANMLECKSLKSNKEEQEETDSFCTDKSETPRKGTNACQINVGKFDESNSPDTKPDAIKSLPKDFESFDDKFLNFVKDDNKKRSKSLRYQLSSKRGIPNMS